MPMRDLCLCAVFFEHADCCSSISRKVISLEEAAREPFVLYSRNEYPDYHEWFESIFAGIAQKPRIVEEDDGAQSSFRPSRRESGSRMVGFRLAYRETALN
jgi:hypothetical protein